MMPRDVTLTRDEVSKWFEEYTIEEPDQSLRDFLIDKINGLNLETTIVDTTVQEGLGPTTELADLILADIGSYGSPDS
jgi:hypothetical protein